MNNIIRLGCFTLLSVSCFGQNTWILRDSVNGSVRSTAAAFSLHDQGWIACGYDGFDDKRFVHSYNPLTDDWDDEESLGGLSGSGLSRKSSIGFGVKGYGYVGLGSGIALFFKDVWQYNDTTQVWTQVADFGGTARREAVAFTLDTLAYVGSGLDAAGLCDDFWVYDASSNSWSPVSSFPGGGRRDAVGFAMGTQAYFGTGVGPSGMTNDFWSYDPVADSWNSLPDFPGTARQGAVGVGVFPQAFIMLGDDIYFDYKQDVWEYNFYGNAWTQRLDFPPGGRTQAIAFTALDRIFVGTGYDGIWYDDLWEYEVLLGDDELLEENVLVYPNPSEGTVQLKLGSALTGATISVFDGRGRTLQEFSYDGCPFTLSGLTSGVNFVSIRLNEKVITRKIIVK